MQSAIQGYIHYHKNNYMRYGITRNSTSGDGFNKVLENVHQQLSHLNDAATLKAQAATLEERYNSLFYGQTGVAANFDQVMQQVIQKKLDEQFGEMAGQFNPSSLSVDDSALSSQIRQAITNTKQRLSAIHTQQSQTITQTLEQINQIENVLSQSEMNSYAEAQQMILKMQTSLNKVKTNLQKQLDLDGNVQIGEATFKNLKNFAKKCKNISPLTAQNGQVFEWLLPFLELTSSSYAEDELDKEMEKLATSKVVGNQQVTIDVQQAKITEQSHAESWAENGIYIDGYKCKIQANRTVKSKVDVNVTYDNAEGSTEEAAVSAKNLSKLGQIKLMHNSTLKTVLELSNQTDFVSHYLNLITVNKYRSQVMSSQYVEKANRYARALALEMAIRGFNGMPNAEFLVVNDQQKQHIYVYNTKVLVYGVQKKLLEGDIKDDKLVSLPANFTIEQHWSNNSPDERQLEVLYKANQKKINVHINLSNLREYNNII